MAKRNPTNQKERIDALESTVAEIGVTLNHIEESIAEQDYTDFDDELESCRDTDIVPSYIEHYNVSFAGESLAHFTFKNEEESQADDLHIVFNQPVSMKESNSFKSWEFNTNGQNVTLYNGAVPKDNSTTLKIGYKRPGLRIVRWFWSEYIYDKKGKPTGGKKLGRQKSRRWPDGKYSNRFF